MRRFGIRSVICGAAILTTAAFTAPGRGAVVYDESVSGDLSNNQAAPTHLNLSLGTNSILASVGPGDSQDWVDLTVPTGDFLSAVTPASFTSATDQQGFTGFQIGSTFVGSAFSAGSYAGYSHWGPGAQNGSNPPASNIGQNIISTMANNAAGGTSAGATGFTQPLGAGDYTFLIQQTGGATSYQFDYTLSAVPEPASALLLGMSSLTLLFRNRRQAREVL